MKTLFFIPVVCIAVTLGAQTTAEATSTTENTGVLQKLKDSPFGFKFVSDTFGSVAKSDVFQSRNRFYFDYKFTDNDTLTSETRVYHHPMNVPSGEESTYIHRTVLRYRRSNILTAENNGVDLGAYVGRRQYVNSNITKTKDYYGLTEVGFDLVKKMGNWTWVVNPQYDLMHRKSSTPETKRDMYYLFAMGAYTLNNKWTVSLWSETLHYNKENSAISGINDETMVFVVPQIDYTIIPGTTLGLYVATTPFKSSDDGQFIRDGWMRDNAIGLYFQSRVF